MAKVYSIYFILFVTACVYAREISRSFSGCPTCMHLDAEVFNMPQPYKTIMESVWENLGLADQNCLNNMTSTSSCPSLIYGLQPKCEIGSMVMTCDGMIVAPFPEARMEVTIITRSCSGETHLDGCYDVNDYMMTGDLGLEHLLAPLRAQWQDVYLTGTVCYTPAM